MRSLRSHQDEEFEFQAEIPRETLADYPVWYAKLDLKEKTKAQRITLYTSLEEKGSRPKTLLPYWNCSSRNRNFLVTA